MQKILLSILLLGMTVYLGAQSVLPIGEWRAHLPYRVGKYVTQSDDKVYFSTGGAIMEVDKDEQSLDFITRVEGLSNVGIEMIRYNRQGQVLIIVYENTVIDLLYDDGSIVTLNQIRNFDNFSGEKVINSLYIENDSIVYLAATYGVSKLNLAAQEFAFTTFTGFPVNDIHLYDEYLYASTDVGIYRIETDNINPDDFGNWKLLGSAEGYPDDYSASAFATFNDELYVAVNDTLFSYKGNSLEFIHYELGSTLEFLTTEGVYLLAGFRPGRVVYFHPDGTQGTIPSNCVKAPNYAIEDERGRIWFGNEEARSDFRFLENINAGFCDAIPVNSPWSEAVWDISIYNGEVWMASGGLDQTLSARFLSDGFASFINGDWTIYNRETTEALKGPNPDPSVTDDDIQVFVSSAIHPGNGNVYMGSYIEGLVEIDENGVFNQYRDTNSTLQEANGDPRVRVGGLAFDEDNNLWISNNSVSKPISVLMPDGTFRSFAVPTCNQNLVYDLAIDGSGYKWLVLGNNSAALMLFDEGELMDDSSDDRCRVFTSNDSELPTNNVNCLAADLEGDIWVGTIEGITIFECGSSAFEDECQGTRRIVEQDGFGAYLLETENVKTIAIDGANRKWVGTENGVFVLSANGEEEIARFTTANSPLFSNDILEIEVDRESGEVFIGTLEGLISYQSDAVSGGNVHKGNITVYPNPVRENYDGPVAIKGLARDATVKITDISGKLVYETTALGGQAIWDARDYNGRRVSSGVYLVFSSSNPRFAGFSGDADTAVAKILVIN